MRFTTPFKGIALLLASPAIVPEFFARSTGREYEIGIWTKVLLALKIARNRARVETATHFYEHLVMSAQVMRVPRSLPGCLVECGTYKGGSAATFSIVAKMCGRQLHIFDSFSGLPDSLGPQHDTYRAGDFCGTLSEVRANIGRCGQLDCCSFHEGFFGSTLPSFSEPCVMAFVDVDLVSSLQDCVKYLWVRMQPGCYFFTHEARDPHIFRLFFNDSWWRDQLSVQAPGLIGAGTGIGLYPIGTGLGSCLGYAIKTSDVNDQDQQSLVAEKARS